jgi:hypothetical protein
VFGIVLVVLFILGGGLILAAVVLSMINPQFRQLAARYMPQRFEQLGGGSRRGISPPPPHKRAIERETHAL